MITPAIAPVADEIMRGAGFEDQKGQDPNIQTVQQPMPAQQIPQAVPQPLQQPTIPMEQ